MAEPPSSSGAVQERSIWYFPLAVAVRPVGAPGAVVVVVVVVVTRLTSMAVPTVRETPDLFHLLLKVVMVVASARTREVLPTTRVRAAVPVVMAVSTLKSNCPLERRKSRMTA